MAQLQFWNPSLAADCSNLFLGEAYCVHGAQQPDGIARGDRVVGRATAIATPTNGWSLVREFLGNVERNHFRAAPVLMQTPMQTPMPEGGVPRGWLGLSSPRMAMGEGAKLPTRAEL